MNLAPFTQLSPDTQLLVILTKGTYLAERWEEKAGVISLYYLPDKARGLLVEVGLDYVQDCFAVLRSFSSSGSLAEYTQGLRLPGV